MLTQAQSHFLTAAFQAATAAHHIFPEYAACEAALESAWGTSELAIEANNLFGRKVWKDGPNVISIPTREFLHGSWVTAPAFWKVFPSIEASFVDRMEILRTDPRYAATLIAAAGEEYLVQVSKVWSTDPNRAKDVLSIWKEHHSMLLAIA